MWIHVRIGIHLGGVVERDKYVTGDAIDIAARLCQKAESGGVALSRVVADELRNQPDIRVKYIGTPELKHIATPIEMFFIVLPWQSNTVPPKPIRYWIAGSASVLAVGAYLVWQAQIPKPLSPATLGIQSALRDTTKPS